MKICSVYTLPDKVHLPSIVKTPNQATYYEEDDLELECASVGNPSPSYTWYLNDSIISASSRYTINGLASTNAGTYKCIAENSFNGATYDQSTEFMLQIGKGSTLSLIIVKQRLLEAVLTTTKTGF